MMNSIKPVSVITLALAVAGAIAGPLVPPAGPPSSTAKPLSDIEPRTAINATNTPGDAGSMFRIVSPGSYYLVDNISVDPGKFAVRAVVPGVTLDLNGFNIHGDRLAAAIDFQSDSSVFGGTIGPIGSMGDIGEGSIARGLVVRLIGGFVSLSERSIVSECVLDFGTSISQGSRLLLRDGAVLKYSHVRGVERLTVEPLATVSHTVVCRVGSLELGDDSRLDTCRVLELAGNISGQDRVRVSDTLIDSLLSFGDNYTAGFGEETQWTRVRLLSREQAAATFARRSILTGCTFVGANSVVTNNRPGVRMGEGAVVRGSVFADFYDEALEVGRGSVVTDCSFTRSGGAVTAFSGSVITGNSVSEMRFRAFQIRGTFLADNSVFLDDGIAILCDGGSRITNNTVTGASIRLQGAGSVVDMNRVKTSIGPSIEAAAAGNVVIRNQLTGGPIATVPGNTVAATVDAVTLDSAGPFANIAY